MLANFSVVGERTFNHLQRKFLPKPFRNSFSTATPANSNRKTIVVGLSQV